MTTLACVFYFLAISFLCAFALGMSLFHASGRADGHAEQSFERLEEQLKTARIIFTVRCQGPARRPFGRHLEISKRMRPKPRVTVDEDFEDLGIGG